MTGDPLGVGAPLNMRVVGELLAAADLSGDVTYLPSCPSTNDVALGLDPVTQPQGWAAAVTDEQTAGRGRLDRSWDSPFGSGVLLSVVSEAPSAHHNPRLGILPLAVGAVVAGGLRDRGVAADVKWPNDIVVSHPQGWGKLGGLLLQAAAPTLVFGVGLNYSVAPALHTDQRGQFPTTLLANGLPAEVSREQIVVDVISAVIDVRDRFLAGQSDELLTEYRDLCVTIGADVAVQLPSGQVINGRVDDIAADGQLVVHTLDGGRTLINSADVRVMQPSDR